MIALPVMEITGIVGCNPKRRDFSYLSHFRVLSNSMRIEQAVLVRSIVRSRVVCGVTGDGLWPAMLASKREKAIDQNMDWTGGREAGQKA